MAQKEGMTRNRLIVFLLVVLMLMTIVETALIVHAVKLARQRPILQLENLENSTTTGEVRLVVVNPTQGDQRT